MDPADKASQLRRAKEAARNREVSVTLPVWAWGFAQEAIEQRAVAHRRHVAISHADHEHREVAEQALTKAAAKITEEVER